MAFKLKHSKTAEARGGHVPTEEQYEILRHRDRNLLVNAFAGTGKSSTMKMVLNDYVDRTGQKALYVAFNRTVVGDMKKEKDRGELNWNVHPMTLNGLGLKAWASACNTITLDEDKFKNLFRLVVGEVQDRDQQELLRDNYIYISKACSLAKNLGYIPSRPLGIGPLYNPKSLVSPEYFYGKLEETPTELDIAAIETILVLSIRQAIAGTIDFDDQIYMPTLFGGSFPEYPLIVVDEGQDLSPINHAMLRRLRTQRLIVVGDRYQSIYAFRGAVTAGLDRLKSTYNMDELTLSVSFRCPSEIVKGVHWHVPSFRWSREGGERATISHISPDELGGGSAIICRNNAPLFSLAFRLIAAGRGCTVMGSDIGPRVIRTLERLAAPETPQDLVLDHINEWQEEKLKSAKKPGTIVDLAECMRVFARHGENLGQAISYAQHLFKGGWSGWREPVTLLTGHKAKGLEFDTVYHIDGDELIDMREEQDKNLRYVIDTRAREALYLLSSKDIVDGNVAKPPSV